jgi:hypothetical protein
VNNPLKRASSLPLNLVNFALKAKLHRLQGRVIRFSSPLQKEVTGFKRGGTTFLNPVAGVFSGEEAY